MTDLLADVRFAFRMIVRRAGTSIAIVAVLAVGTAANSSMFSGFDAWLVRPLPFDRPERLAFVNEAQPKIGRLGQVVAPSTFRDWQEQQRVFTGMEAFSRASFGLYDDVEPENAVGAYVSAGLFPMLGVQPVLGRQLLPEEDSDGGPRAVLIGYRMWERRFGKDPQVLGKLLRVDGIPHRIVGVMPLGFEFPEWGQLWTGLRLPQGDERHGRRWLTVMARMKDGTSIARAQSAMDAIASRVAAQHPDTNRDWGADVQAMRDGLVPPVIRVAIASCLAVALLVMLIICSNVASLVLARATARERETALRAALGASRWRLARLAMTETMLLAVAAGGLGFWLAQWLMEWTLSWVPADPPYMFEIRMDARVAAFTLLLAGGVGVLLGFAPVLRAARGNVFSALRTGGITASAAPASGRLSALLIVGQFAVSVVLAIAALLMVKNFYRQQIVDPGFATNGVATARLSLAATRYSSPSVRADFMEQLLDRLRRVPAIERAGYTNHLPVSSSGYQRLRLDVDDRPTQPGTEPEASFYLVSEGYLETLRLPLLDGRRFEAGELREGAPVALVSRSLAEHLWPGRSPLRRRVRALGGEPEWLTVIGVVGDIRPGATMVDASNRPRAELYLPFRRQPPAALSLALASRAAPEALSAILRRELRALDPALAPSRLLTMDQTVDEVRWVERYFTRLLSLYASLALGFAAVGAYGLTADSVGRRRREMAIRIALGADPRGLTKRYAAQGVLLGGCGILLGLLGAFPATWFAGSMLTNVGPHDPVVFSTVALLMAFVACLATYLPARHAARTDPLEVLRAE